MNVYNSKDYNKCVDLMIAFCQTIEKAGYFSGIYSNGRIFLDIKKHATNSKELDNYVQWLSAYGNDPKGHITKIGYNGQISLENNIMAVQVAQYGKVDGIKNSVDVNVSLIKLRERVCKFYIEKYGESYYQDSQLSIRSQNSRITSNLSSHRYKTKTQNSDVSMTLVQAIQGGRIGKNAALKSTKGSKIAYTSINPSLKRFNKGNLSRTLHIQK